MPRYVRSRFNTGRVGEELHEVMAYDGRIQKLLGSRS